MPDDTGEQESTPAGGGTPASAGVSARLQHAQELLAEVRRQRDTLERQVQAQQQQIEQDATERAELRRLIDVLQSRLSTSPGTAGQGDSLEPPAASSPSGWREGKRGLGASLTLTGVAALAAGIILHFALQERLIISAAHLGYIIGLVGVLTFLLGLLLVY